MSCKLCGMKPKFEYNQYTNSVDFRDYDNEFDIADGPWTVMYAGVDADGRIRLTAEGDGRADYYPKFCPECGRRLTDEKLSGL